MRPNLHESVNLVAFTEEIHDGKLQFFVVKLFRASHHKETS